MCITIRLQSSSAITLTEVSPIPEIASSHSLWGSATGLHTLILPFPFSISSRHFYYTTHLWMCWRLRVHASEPRNQQKRNDIPQILSPSATANSLSSSDCLVPVSNTPCSNTGLHFKTALPPWLLSALSPHVAAIMLKAFPSLMLSCLLPHQRHKGTLSQLY